MRSSIETRVGVFVLLALGIFGYMGLQIGAFRFDRTRYQSFTVFFKDISGLSRKAEVKIAGVKVGWVDAITLRTDESVVEADVMIAKDYKLYSDAYAIVRQDGLLGPKYLEIVPGDPILRPLEAGEALKRPSKTPVAVDDVLQKVKIIASNMEEITDSFKNAVGGVHGKEQLVDMIGNLGHAAERLASFSESIDRAIGRNEEKIDNLFAVGADIRRLSEKIETQLVPSIQDGVDNVSHVLDRDFDRIATTLATTAESFEDAAIQAQESLRNFNSVVEKIDEGKGLIGKLINDDETYRDIRVATQGIKNYFSQIDRMQIVFDSHFESMQRPAENYRYPDSKGYFDVRVHPNDDYFYLLQLVVSEHGFIDRKEVLREYFDTQGLQIAADTLVFTDRDPRRCNINFEERKQKIYRGALRFGVQFGKIFKNLAFRFGIFDSTAGLAVDFEIPFKSEKFRWVTSFEMFDYTGWNRIHDRRPHVKWINRVFMFRNAYVTFGADDFVSKHNASAFFGAGLRFGDDDIKYVLPSLGSAASATSSINWN